MQCGTGAHRHIPPERVAGGMSGLIASSATSAGARLRTLLDRAERLAATASDRVQKPCL